MKMKKITLVIPAILLAGCSLPVQQAEPAPTVTVTQEAPSYSPDEYTSSEAELQRTALEIVWDDLSVSDRATMCQAYRLYPDEAFEAFNEGADGIAIRRVFDSFFDEECY